MLGKTDIVGGPEPCTVFMLPTPAPNITWDWSKPKCTDTTLR